MMKLDKIKVEQKHNLLIILLLSAFSIGMANAQSLQPKTAENSQGNKLIAKNINININEQQALIDSLSSIDDGFDDIEDFDEDGDFDEFDLPNGDNNPANYLYSGEWDNSKLNPYQIKIISLPDSFVVDCSDFYPPVENVVTSEYGPRWRRFHAGIDLRVKVGDTIRSAFDGKIRITKTEKKGYGNYIVIRHDNGLETLYGHLSKISVQPNQTVKAGEMIGLGGNTGRSTGPHLHFEMRFLGNAFNPRKMIDFECFVVFNDTYTIKKQETFSELTAYLNSPERYYKVKSGDTLSKIAKNNRTTVDRLLKLNKLSSTSILRVGQRIRIS